MSQAGRGSGFVPVGTFIETITGNTGGPVGPDGAGNITLVGDVANNISVAGNAGANMLDIVITGTTFHSLLVGNSSGSLANLGVATNGQLPIGSTGADPVLATLTAGTGVSIANGVGSITISSSGTTTLTYTDVSSSPYVVLATDQYLSVDCSGGPITLQFPNAATTGRTYVVKDRTGSANTNNITITTVGGVVNIDGAASYVMNTQYSSVQLMGNSVSYEIF